MGRKLLATIMVIGMGVMPATAIAYPIDCGKACRPHPVVKQGHHPKPTPHRKHR